MAHIDLAIIGGTGVYALVDLVDVDTHQPVTHYGAPSGPVRTGSSGIQCGGGACARW